MTREIDRIKEIYRYRKEVISADTYSYFNPGNLFNMHMKEKNVLRLLYKHGIKTLKDFKILEIGCGNGAWLRDFVKYGADPKNLFGIELLEERVEEAKMLNPNFNISEGNAEILDFDDNNFDIVLQRAVFTSILHHGMKDNIAREMLRVVRAGGIVLWYDFRFNNYRNPHVRGIGKNEIKSLFPGCTYDIQKIILFPFAARKIGKYGWLLCRLLSHFPFLLTHYLAVIRKNTETQ